MVYNLTTGNETGLVDIIQVVNSELTFGVGFTLLLMAIGVILFMSFLLKTQDASKSLITTSMICFILALSLRGLDLVGNLAIFITLIGFAASLAIGYFSDNG